MLPQLCFQAAIVEFFLIHGVSEYSSAPASGRVSSTRASGPSLNTQPQQLVPSSAQPSDYPEAIPQCPDILLGSQTPLHPATTLSLQQHAILAGA